MANQSTQHSKQAAPAEAVDIPAAVAFFKKNPGSKFDETIELHVKLGVDPTKSDQAVRGNVKLPAGSVKQQKIVVFTTSPEQQEAAKQAGARQAGGEELIATVTKNGSLDADVTIATPDMMPKIASIARILGPKGLMPNPKTGTVSDDPAKVVADLASGQVSFKMDQGGNIHQAVAKLSWDEDKIIDNLNAVLAAIKDSRPAATKGEFIKRTTVSTTMGPGVQITGV